MLSAWAAVEKVMVDSVLPVEPVVDPIVLPVVDPVVESVVDPVVLPVVDPVVLPVVDLVVEPVDDPVVLPAVVVGLQRGPLQMPNPVVPVVDPEVIPDDPVEPLILVASVERAVVTSVP